jgi:hypothetical protein
MAMIIRVQWKWSWCSSLGSQEPAHDITLAAAAARLQHVVVAIVVSRYGKPSCSDDGPILAAL